MVCNYSSFARTQETKGHENNWIVLRSFDQPMIKVSEGCELFNGSKKRLGCVGRGWGIKECVVTKSVDMLGKKVDCFTE